MTLRYHTSSLRQEASATVRLAGPVVIAQLGMMTMGLVDVLMVGPLGPEALAAVALGNALFFAFLIFGGGTLMALDTLVSQAVGAGVEKRAGALLWQGVWLAVALGLVLNVLYLDVEWALVRLGQPEEVIGPAADYLAARSFSAIPFLVFGACRGLLNGVGDTRPVMIVTLVANAVNVVADAVLIHGLLGVPALGVVGAGVATTFVRWFMLIAIVYVLRDPRYRRYDLAFRRPEPVAILRILRLGLPIGGQFVVEVGLFSVTGILVGWIGAAPLAKHQIALSCASFTFMVPLGIGVAATVRVGRAIGRRDPDGAMRAGRVALLLGLAAMVIPSVVFLLAPALLARAFTADPDVIAGAAMLLRIAAVFQIADGLQAVAAGCLRGAGDMRTPLWANVFSHWVVGLPLGAALAFGLGWGTVGLWWGLTVALTLAALLLGALFLRGGWRRIERLV